MASRLSMRRAFPLELIRRMLEASGESGEEVMRFARALRAPFRETDAPVVDRKEWQRTWGAGPAELERAVELGLVRERPDGKLEFTSSRTREGRRDPARPGPQPEGDPRRDRRDPGAARQDRRSLRAGLARRTSGSRSSRRARRRTGCPPSRRPSRRCSRSRRRPSSACSPSPWRRRSSRGSPARWRGRPTRRPARGAGSARSGRRTPWPRARRGSRRRPSRRRP